MGDKGEKWVTALIQVPLSYNPDKQGRRRKIEDEKFHTTCVEVGQKFGGGLLRLIPRGEAKNMGIWFEKGIIYEDNIAVLEVDIPDTDEDRFWLEEYARNILLKRFEQKAICIKFVGPVEPKIIQVPKL